MGAMLNYYGNATNVLICPLAPNPVGTPGQNTNGTAASAWQWGLSTPEYAASYGYNDWLTGSSTDSRYFKNDAQVQFPTMTPMFMDAAWINFWPTPTDPPARNLYDPLGSSTATGMTRICIARHGNRPPTSAPRVVPPGTILPGKIMMTFTDGHVEAAPLQNLWGYYWYNQYTPPATRPN
jgi:prepilin-type processing-associated H-X9-DG protein